MEFTAEKCEWQAHSEDEWRHVRAGSLLSTDGSNWDTRRDLADVFGRENPMKVYELGRNSP